MTFDWWVALPTAAGVGMGLLYALSGFHAGTQADLAKNPRWTNLKWVASVAGAALIGDWDKLAGAANISKVEMTAVYLVVVIVTAVITIGWIAGSIYRDRKAEVALGRLDRPDRMTARQIALLYVQKGYPAYYAELALDGAWLKEKAERERDERDREQQRAEQETQKRHDAKFVQLVRLRGCADYSYSIGRRIAAASSVNAHSSPPYRDTQVDTLLSEMVSVAIQQTALAENEFAINFMEAMPFAAGITKFRDVTQFVFEPPEHYDRLLILKRYVGRGGGEDFGLPVHKKGASARPLPGAPSVLFDGKSRYVQVDTFAKDFARALKEGELKQIRDYLESQPFACFLSLPIQWGGQRLGVVNLDCKTRRFGIEGDPAEAFATTLLPFCMLLGTVMSVAYRKGDHEHKADD